MSCSGQTKPSGLETGRMVVYQLVNDSVEKVVGKVRFDPSNKDHLRSVTPRLLETPGAGVGEIQFFDSIFEIREKCLRHFLRTQLGAAAVPSPTPRWIIPD